MPRKLQRRPATSRKRLPRRVCYSAAISLDGFIADSSDQFDWIVADPEVDFSEHFNRFDTLLMGRRTFEVMRAQGDDGSMSGMQVYVFSRTLKQRDHRKVKVAHNAEEVVAKLRTQPGKEIALFGGGSLFRSLIEAELVDSLEVAVIPVLLGEGVPLMSPPGKRVTLKLTGSRLYSKTGTMRLEYAVQYAKKPKRTR